ncbi:MAG: hypothetical protein H0W94_06605, partial [Actinobacteria bacterium]|nr:hypothetical protein [Actinomycetota bacterium]
MGFSPGGRAVEGVGEAASEGEAEAGGEVLGAALLNRALRECKASRYVPVSGTRDELGVDGRALGMLAHGAGAAHRAGSSKSASRREPRS